MGDVMLHGGASVQLSDLLRPDCGAPENRLELIKSSRCKSHTPFHDGAVGSSPLRPNLNTSMNDD